MAQLTDLLSNSPTFQSLPEEKREIFARLAAEFEENDLAIHLSPTELTAKLQIGNRELWQQFLQMDSVLAYIKSQMSFNAQVAHRKAFVALQREALTGDVQAAKQVNELAGIYNQADNNKIVVLHRVNRPKEATKP